MKQQLQDNFCANINKTKKTKPERFVQSYQLVSIFNIGSTKEHAVLLYEMTGAMIPTKKHLRSKQDGAALSVQ